MELVASKKAEEDASNLSNTKASMSCTKAGMSYKKAWMSCQEAWRSCTKAWMSCKEAATDRTFILPFAIICCLFTFQALSG